MRVEAQVDNASVDDNDDGYLVTPEEQVFAAFDAAMPPRMEREHPIDELQAASVLGYIPPRVAKFKFRALRFPGGGAYARFLLGAPYVDKAVRQIIRVQLCASIERRHIALDPSNPKAVLRAIRKVRAEQRTRRQRVIEFRSDL